MLLRQLSLVLQLVLPVLSLVLQLVLVVRQLLLPHRCKSVSLSKMKNSPGQETLSQQSVPTPLNVVHCASEKEASKSEAKTQPTSAMAGGTSVASNMDRPPWM